MNALAGKRLGHVSYLSNNVKNEGSGVGHAVRPLCSVTPMSTISMEQLSALIQYSVDHVVELLTILIAVVLFARVIPWILSPRVPAVELDLPAGMASPSFPIVFCMRQPHDDMSLIHSFV